MNFIQEWFFYGASILLILIGLYGILSQQNLIKIIIGIGIMNTGVNLLLIAIGYVNNGKAPILTETVKNNNLSFVDPLPQALVLTSIVISVAVMALALTIVVKIYHKYHTLDISKVRGLRW